MSHFIKILRNPHFWIILATFLICITLHYPQQLFFGWGAGPSAFFGLSRHAIERILFLFPVVYAGIIFGLWGGIVYLAIAFASMLPRAIFISSYPMDALFETFAVVVAGGLANWWLEARRRETGRREQALLTLEAVRRELQSYIQVIKENEKRLSTLHTISTAVNQSLDLEEVANVAINKIMEVVDIDAVLLFVLNKESGWLELEEYQGVSEDFAREVDRLMVGEGFNGQVAQTGEPLFIEDSAFDPRLSREVVKREGLNSQFIVPLKSGDEVVGTLCIGVRRLKIFTSDEKELLRLIGIELGIAIQKARLYQESQLYIHQITRAHEEERNRIARELHDDTIQELIAISHRLDTIASRNDLISDEMLKSVEELRREIDGILRGMRRFTQDLRPPTLEYLGLLPALRELVSQVREEFNLDANLKVNGTSQHFTKEEEMLIYRIIQEALRNIWKHAEATKVDVTVEFRNRKTSVIVSDNGKGFEQQEGLELAKTSKLGLIGMYERSRLLGGTLEIKSELGKGTQVIADLPL